MTLAVVAHSETVVSGPSMKAAEAAIEKAKEAGYSVERLVGFDSPTEGCRDYFGQPAYDSWSKQHFRFGHQGRVRNALAEIAVGRWLIFSDAGDLFSENWLIEALNLLSAAEEAGERVIVHPELNWQFDGARQVHTRIAQADLLFSPIELLIRNPYDAMCAAPRDAWLENPYPDRGAGDGCSFGGWEWSVQTMGNGWQHVVARDTIIFKRRHDLSPSTRSACNSLPDALAIDRIASIGGEKNSK
ncbi:MAG: hypothetical protein H6874_00175 [Hyphomicrobiaceae bacterium]|nr:hypothetical protein [Hyphomicrobiaceae bacterium]